jgi:hypothetical protein
MILLITLVTCTPQHTHTHYSDGMLEFRGEERPDTVGTSLSCSIASRSMDFHLVHHSITQHVEW